MESEWCWHVRIMITVTAAQGGTRQHTHVLLQLINNCSHGITQQSDSSWGQLPDQQALWLLQHTEQQQD